VGWFFNKVPKEREPFVQNSIPHWYSPLVDEKTGRWISTHVMNQDFIGWVGQGTFADRTQEHLGKSDKGIAMIRRRFFDDMERIERGEDPKAIMRDPKENERIQLPIVGLDAFRNGLTSKELENAGGEERLASKKFIFQAGQPPEVKRAYEDAMGFKMTDW